MARSRNIKPGFFKNEELAVFPAMTRLLFAGLWTIADKSGRLEDRPRRIKADLFPFDDITADEIETMLGQLASGSEPFIVRYMHESCKLIQVVNWERHQSPYHREKESILPPPTNANISLAGPKPGPNRVVTRNGGNQESGIRNQESLEGVQGKPSAPRFKPPSVEEVAAYCAERKNRVDPQLFVDFYAGKGWKVGTASMKDWQACVRTWEKNENNQRGSPRKSRLNVTDGHLFNPNAETIHEI